MTAKELWKARAAILAIAHQEGKTEQEVKDAIQKAIDAAWTATWQPGNILAQVKWQRLFGCRKPSVEECIARCAANVQCPK